MSKLKKIPKFKSEAEESEFWATHDSTEYVDYSTAKRIAFPNLKPSTKTISIRLPESLIEHQGTCEQKGCSLPVATKDVSVRKG